MSFLGNVWLSVEGVLRLGLGIRAPIHQRGGDSRYVGYRRVLCSVQCSLSSRDVILFDLRMQLTRDV